MGGGRTPTTLPQMLLEMKAHVSIIEIDPERARVISEAFPAANVILGDGTDKELLLSEDIGTYDAFITLTGWTRRRTWPAFAQGKQRAQGHRQEQPRPLRRHADSAGHRQHIGLPGW